MQNHDLPLVSFQPIAVALLVLGAFAGTAVASIWASDPTALFAVASGLCLFALTLLLMSCLPLLRKPSTHTGSAS